MLAGTLQHVDELVVRIEVVQPAGCQQASQVTSIPGASSVQLNVSDQAAVKALRWYRSCKATSNYWFLKTCGRESSVRRVYCEIFSRFGFQQALGVAAPVVDTTPCLLVCSDSARFFERYCPF